MTKLITRVSVILTMVFGFFFIGCDFEASNIKNVFIIGILLVIFGFISYKNLKNMSEEEIKSIFGMTWIEKKIGINFVEE